MNSGSPIVLFYQMEAYTFPTLDDCFKFIPAVTNQISLKISTITELQTFNKKLENKLYFFPLYGIQPDDTLQELRKILMTSTEISFPTIVKMSNYELCQTLTKSNLPEHEAFTIFEIRKDYIFPTKGLILKNRSDDFFYIEKPKNIYKEKSPIL